MIRREVIFFVPGAAVGKGRPRVGRAGGHARLFTPQRTVAYEGMVALAAQTAMAGRPVLDGAVTVGLDIRCQIPASWSSKKRRAALDDEIQPTTRPDIDNVEKSIFDGLNGIVWRDDVQVVCVIKRKRYADRPGVLVQIEPFASPLGEVMP